MTTTTRTVYTAMDLRRSFLLGADIASDVPPYQLTRAGIISVLCRGWCEVRYYKEDGIERTFTVTMLDGACLRAEEAYEADHAAHVAVILDYPSLTHAYVNELRRWHNESDRIAAMAPGVGRHVEAICRTDLRYSITHWEDRGITVLAKIGDRCEYRCLKPSRIHGLGLLMG